MNVQILGLTEIFHPRARAGRPLDLSQFLPRQKPKAPKRNWRLLQSYGDGTADFVDYEARVIARRKIRQPNAMERPLSYDAHVYFFGTGPA